MSQLQVILTDGEFGTSQPGAGLGPEAILRAACVEGLRLTETPTEILRAPRTTRRQLREPSLTRMPEFVNYAERLCRAHRDGLARNARTLILSSDHANAAGWYAGFADAFAGRKTGLIWLDAHADIHSPFTTPSQNIHGMPVASLLAYDGYAHGHRDVEVRHRQSWDQLKRLGSRNVFPKLSPKDLTFVELRDAEKEEWSAIHSMGIDCISAEQRRKLSIESIADALWKKYATYDAVYVSFDIDALDPEVAPGTGCQVPGGLSLQEATRLLKTIVSLPSLKTLEICEYNPLLDTRGQTARAVVEILREIEPLIFPSARSSMWIEGAPWSIANQRSSHNVASSPL